MAGLQVMRYRTHDGRTVVELMDVATIAKHVANLAAHALIRCETVDQAIELLEHLNKLEPEDDDNLMLNGNMLAAQAIREARTTIEN